MTTETRRVAIVAALCWLSFSIAGRAAEINGVVREAKNNEAIVTLEGDALPSVGDKAEVFFKLDGVEGDISVATGSVLKVEGDSIQLRIEKATGEVAKGQLVRIISPSSSNGKATSPSMAPKGADAETAYELGLQYHRGGGAVLIDHKKSFESFQRAAEQNLPEAQACLAELWSQREWVDFMHAPDAAKAAEFAKQALAGGLEARAEAGKHQSEFELGSLYLYGLGVQKDEAKAAKLFRAAADQGNKDAKRALGYLYWTGTGVTRDPLTAEGYLKEAAAENIASAQLLLGILYSSGDGKLEKSEDKAVALFQQAANQGLPGAMDKLAECLEKGSGVQQNPTKALEWYQRAADRGLWSSQQKLGEMYEQGRGVTKDLTKAAEYYQKVADQEIKQGKDALERLQSRKREENAPVSAPPTVPTRSVTSDPIPASAPPVSPPTSTAPPRRGKLVLEDTFDNPEDLPMIDSNKNVNGERQIIANPGANRVRPYINLPRDFYAQCSVRSAGSDLNCAVGLAFHALAKDGPAFTYHSIFLAPGFVQFVSVRDGKKALMAWQYYRGGASPWQALPSGIYPDATRSTAVGLEVIGSEVRLFINDNCVANFAINHPSEGRGFMLVVQSIGQTPCTAYFDDMKIYAASTAGETSGEKKAKFKPRKR